MDLAAGCQGHDRPCPQQIRQRNGEHEESARKSKGASMHAASARTLPPDFIETGGSCVNLVEDNPWRLPVPSTSRPSLTPFTTLTHRGSLATSFESKGRGHRASGRIQRPITRPTDIWATQGILSNFNQKSTFHNLNLPHSNCE